jgi:hypothetical protein
MQRLNAGHLMLVYTVNEYDSAIRFDSFIVWGFKE